MRGVSIALLVVGCRTGFDALVDGNSRADGAASWSTPQPISAINSDVDEDDATMSGDMLEIVLESDRAATGAGDLFAATRADLDSPWGDPMPIAELNTSSDDGSPMLSRDGSTLIFTSDRPGGAGGGDLYITTRPDRASPWSAPTRVTELCTAKEDAHLTISMDGRTAWMVRTTVGMISTANIVVTTRSDVAGPWSATAAVTELNTQSADDSPFIDDSGLVIWFSSRRDGDSNIYTATRPTVDAAWTAITAFAPVNTTAAESDPWISPDDKTLMFTRDTGTSRDIFITTLH